MGDNTDTQKSTEDTGSDRYGDKRRHSRKAHKESLSVKSMGPTMVLLWVWGWVSTVPKTVASVYSVLTSGKFWSRFTFLDAMMQFLVAVATSCHPQDDGNPYGDSCEDEAPTDKKDGSSKCGSKVCDGVEVFGGTGRTLRSRVVETEPRSRVVETET